MRAKARTLERILSHMSRPAKMPDPATCDKIAQLRAAHGLTYKVLALRFELSPPTVKKIIQEHTKR